MTETKKENIFEKVARIQGEISLKKDGKNPFYKSKYITLDNIMDKLQPLLDKE
ncbi:MAG: ERF family protein [Clostridiales bacterium]|nr:ERF family protein [Clostridiales bacterium]